MEDQHKSDDQAKSSGQFGGSLGSQQSGAAQQSLDDAESGPTLQPGPSGSSPKQRAVPNDISGQKGSGSPSPAPPRRSGCFGAVLAVLLALGLALAAWNT